MSLVAALLISAQTAAPQVAEASARSPSARANPVAVQVRASARIIRPVEVDFSKFEEVRKSIPDPAAREAQHRRDAAGTPWIEFS